MSTLPIASRELRVASRKVRTYWVRMIVAGLGIGLFAFTFWLARMGSPWTSFQMFQLIAWFGFAYCLFAGALAMADALSGEKRENTLGLLFLTDLKGYDIVLGKLAANSLGCVYGMFALLPVLAIPLIMGGVQYGDFWRVALSLMNTLFLSLAVGLFVSGCSRNPFRATAVAVLVMFLLAVGTALLSLWLLHYWKQPKAAYFVSLVSSFQTHSWALTRMRWGLANSYWLPLLVTHLMGWGFLLLTCWMLPRAWQETPGKRSLVSPKELIRRWQAWNLGSGEVRRNFRGRLMERNPFKWLAGRERVSSSGSLMLAVLVVCGGAWVASTLLTMSGRTNMEEQLVVWILSGVLLHLFLLFKVSSSACERFGEDRQSGALELVLSTPLPVGTILRGQWQALGRQLFGPGLITLLVHGFVLIHAFTMIALTTGSPLAPGQLLRASLGNIAKVNPTGPWEECFMVLLILSSALTLVAHWITLGWMGMWMSLRLRQPRFAPWAALAIVLIPPWVVFVGTVIGMLDFESTWTEGRWFFTCWKLLLGYHLASDLLLSTWASWNLRTRFRTAATDRFQTEGAGLGWALALRWAFRMAAVMGVIGGLLAIFHYVENRRGERAWRDFQAKVPAEEELDLESILLSLAPVSAERNFAETRAWKDVMAGFSIGQPSGPPRGPRRAVASRGAITAGLNGVPRPWFAWVPQERWPHQKHVVLEEWQKVYRTLGVVPTNSGPRSAAADVLLGLSRFDADMDDLRDAAQRPLCRYPPTSPLAWNSYPPHLGALAGISEVLELRASAALREGEITQAFEDVRLWLYLAETLKGEPSSSSHNLRRDLLAGALQPVWEGLSMGCWNEQQLSWFQGRLGEIQVLDEQALRWRAAILDQMKAWEQKRTGRGRQPRLEGITQVFSPQGWTYQNQLEVYRFYTNHLVNLFDPGLPRVFPTRTEETVLAMERRTCFGRVTVQQVRDLQAFAFVHTALAQARVACALERYRLDHGEYPLALEALEGFYIESVPHDVIDGKALKYRRISPGEFVLYSVGWNEKDDGGTYGNDADWVWRSRSR